MVKTVRESTIAHKLNLKKTVPLILFTMFFGVMNETVFNVSTPKVAAQFNLSPADVSWIITIFMITFSIGTVVYGKLADIYGIRNLITLGLVIYALGAIVGFLLQEWYAAVIIGRAIQGAGASAIPALITVIAARYFAPEDRGKLFGILASTSSFAIGVGPVIGGVISAYIHWSALFLLSLFTLLAIPFFRRILPQEEKKAKKIDIVGILTLSGCVAAFIFWFTQPSLLPLLIGIVGLIAFIWRIRTASEPFIDPDLFISRSYRTGLLVGILLFIVTFCIPFVLPLFLSGIHKLDTDWIGLILFPGTFSAVIFGTIAGRLVAKKGVNYVMFFGLVLTLSALVGLTFLIDHWIWFIAAALVPLYIGFSFVQTSLWDKMAQIIPLERMGIGMGFFTLISQVFGAFGTALIAQLLKQEWFHNSLLPILDKGTAQVYGNIFIGFTLLIVIAGVLYWMAFAHTKQKIQLEERGE